MQPGTRPAATRAAARTLGVLVAALLTLWATVGGALAQTSPSLEIVEIAHDTVGVVTASFTASGGSELDPERVEAMVDGTPYPVTLSGSEQEPLSLVIAIETSSSMPGLPLRTAQDLALGLIAELAPQDQVAVISFGDETTVAQPFSADHDAARSAVRGLTTTGYSRLHDSVILATELLAAAPSESRALVVLTFGWEFGSTAGRSESLARLDEASVPTYVVAVGFDFEEEYLRALAGADGAFWPRAAGSDLHAAFAELRRQHTRHTVRVTVPPLALGEHTLALRAAGEASQSERAFEVRNEGLLSATSLAAGGDGGDPLLVELRSAAGLEGLALSATARGRALPVDPASGRVTVDPWAFAPGPLEIEVTAHVGGRLAGSTEATVDVPALEPRLELLPDDPEQPTKLVVSWRAQAGTALVLVATSDGAEVVRSTAPEVRIPVVEGGEVLVRLEDGAGTALANRSYSVPRAAAATGSSSGIWWLALAVAGVAVALTVAYFAWRQFAAGSRRRSLRWPTNRPSAWHAPWHPARRSLARLRIAGPARPARGRRDDGPAVAPPSAGAGNAAPGAGADGLGAAFARPRIQRLERTLVVIATAVAAIVLLAIAAAGLPTLIGYDSYVVGGASMGNAVRPGSILVAERVDPASLEVGDIVTFRRPQNPDVVVTHRVIGIRAEDGVIKLQTQGDANLSRDPEEVSTSLPISKMVYTIPYAGYVVTFARTAAGKLLLIVLPLVILLAEWLYREFFARDDDERDLIDFVPRARPSGPEATWPPDSPVVHRREAPPMSRPMEPQRLWQARLRTRADEFPLAAGAEDQARPPGQRGLGPVWERSEPTQEPSEPTD